MNGEIKTKNTVSFLPSTPFFKKVSCSTASTNTAIAVNLSKSSGYLQDLQGGEKAKDAQLNHFDTINNLLCKYQVSVLQPFLFYLYEIWRELTLQTPNMTKKELVGISRFQFSQYYGLPGGINKRLFELFDVSCLGCINPKDFIFGMLTLFAESGDNLINFIFNFIDFNNDGLISKEDIRIILAYLPILQDFNSVIQVEDELFAMLEILFNTRETLNLQDYRNEILVNGNYGIFIPIAVFLYEHKPFSTNEINEIYILYTDKMLIGNKYKIIVKNARNRNVPKKKTGLKIKSMEYKHSENKFILNRYTSKVNEGGIFKRRSLKTRSVLEKNKPFDLEKILSSRGFLQLKETIPSVLKSSNLLKRIVSMKPKETPKIEEKHELNFSNHINSDNEEYDNFEDEDNGPGDESSDLGVTGEIIKSRTNSNDIKQESYLFKQSHHSNKMKMLYYKLYNKDLFSFQNENSLIHKGMHNGSHAFGKHKPAPTNIDGVDYYSFKLIFPESNKTHIYYTNSLQIYSQWTMSLSNVLGVKKISKLYEMKDVIGKGKFSVVTAAVDKKTRRNVAIKTITKKDLTNEDYECIKTEIDIGKICHHPNIIQLYDVIETLSHIYLILEYCEGGNGYSYLEKRNFELSEAKIANIIHKISTAVYSMQNLGIIHRDGKCGNIVMTDSTDFSDLKIGDFGLSKIICPGEKCTDSYGTVGYASPEVIQENNYDFKADIWCIGVITYFGLSKSGPFDYVNDKTNKKNICYNTVHDEVSFHRQEIWESVSIEGKNFCREGLNKDVEERGSIKQVLEHEWLSKYYDDGIERRKSSNNTLLNKKNNGGVDTHSVYRIYASTFGN